MFELSSAQIQARRELTDRGYRLAPRPVYSDRSKLENQVELWISSRRRSVLLVLDHEGGWDLFAQVDTTNDVAATWSKLDANLLD